MQIKEVGIFEYFILFSNCRTPLSDFYINTNEMGVHILGAWEKEEVKGFLLYKQQGSFVELLYLNCVNYETGIEEQLLRTLIETGKTLSWKCILFRIKEESIQYTILKNWLETNGFCKIRTMQLFQIDMKDYIHWKNYRNRHGEKVLRFLEREGFQAIPFCEVSEKVLKEIVENPRNAFENTFQPGQIIAGRKGTFCWEISHLSLKENHVAAYCLVTNPSQGRYVFELISAATQYQNMGVIFQSFCLAIDALENVSCERVAFAMDIQNKRAIAISKRILEPLIQSVKIQYDYEYNY